VKNQKLAGLKPSFEIAAMKKLARQQPAGLVLDQQMVDSVAAEAPVSNGLAADHPRANGVGSVWLNVFHLRELDPVFVAKRQVPEQISHRVDVTLGEQCRALRAHALDHARFAREAHGHGLLFISSPRGPCGKRETCVAPPRTDTVSESCLREKARRSSGNGGRSGSRGFNGFGKARAASVGGGGDPGHGVCSEILFSGVSGSFRQFSSLAGRSARAGAEVRYRPRREPERL